MADTGGHAARGGDPHLALHPLLVEGPGHLGVQVRPAGGLLSLLDVSHDGASYGDVWGGSPPVGRDLDEILVDFEDQLCPLERSSGLNLELLQLHHVGDDGDGLGDSVR